MSKRKSAKKRNMHPILIGILVLLALWTAWGFMMVRNIEQPSYTVVESSKEYEIRQYDSYIVAEAEVDAEFREGLNSGFRLVADFIFGNNTKQESIAMTTPVTSEEAEGESEPIAMTAPVIREESEPIAMTSPVVSEEGSEKRTVAFVMPSQYTLETLPKPNNDKVTIREVPARKVAVLRFTGWYKARTVEKKKAKLLEYLNRDGLEYSSTSFAGYNPPWSPPFMMRNEVWAELK